MLVFQALDIQMMGDICVLYCYIVIVLSVRTVAHKIIITLTHNLSKIRFLRSAPYTLTQSTRRGSKKSDFTLIALIHTMPYRIKISDPTL